MDKNKNPKDSKSRMNPSTGNRPSESSDNRTGSARASRLRDQDMEQGGSVHLGRTGKDGVLTQHEKTPREMREMGDDLRESDEYMDPADENDLEENHLAEDEE